MDAPVGPVRRFVVASAPAWLTCIGYLAAFTVAAATWSVVHAERKAAAMARFGETAAVELAFLAAEPLLRQDRIRLSLLAGRMVDRPEVGGIAIHTVDQQPFVVVGASARRGADQLLGPYIEPVTVDHTVVGDVRVILHADSFGVSAQQLLAAAWPFWLAGLVLVAGVVQCGWILATRPKRRGKSNGATVDESAPHTTTYLLVANLFARHGTAADQREPILRDGRAIAEQVAAGRNGAVAELPGTGLLLAFDAGEQSDRAFEVVCAALELRQRLATQQAEQAESDEVPIDGRPWFRYCLDATTNAPNIQLQALGAQPQSRAVVLLSSLAPDGEIIVCERAYAQLAAPERLLLDDFDNPAAAALTADAAPKGIVRGLAEAPSDGDS